MKRNVWIICMGCLFFLWASVFPTLVHSQEKDQPDITHNVTVGLMLAPVFVTGDDDAPVFDLKKEDFQLLINGKPYEIANFIPFDYKYHLEVEEKTRQPAVESKQPSRAVFIIIDSVFNSFFGFRRARQISADIIRNGAKDDIFFVLENRAGMGLRFIAGPGQSREQMIKRINKLKLPSAKWSKSLHMSRQWDYEADEDSYDAAFSNASFENLKNQERFAEKSAYQNQVRSFSHFLSRFKYALKTVTRPKVVFLISEGISRATFKQLQEEKKVADYGRNSSAFLVDEATVAEKSEARDMLLFRDLQQIVTAINEGGSVLYTVNPGKLARDNEASGEMSLRFLASESGGRYVGGRDTEKITTRIRKYTSAYYEIAFTPPAEAPQNITVEIKCTRPGVTVSSLKRTERTKTYVQMDVMARKLFALNMVTGGGWSRVTGKVVRIKYKKITPKDSKDPNQNNILIPLPKRMMHKRLDMFSITIDPLTNKVDVKMVQADVKEDAHLIIKKGKKTRHFFVLIEPNEVLCIYNQV